MSSALALSKLRAWWSHRQALDGRLAGDRPDAVLAETGWARSVGGAAPYLTLWSRCHAGRQAVDDAAQELRLYELPAARGCTYVVPASDFALALAAAQSFGVGEVKVAASLGVTTDEIENLCAAVTNALVAGSPLQPDEIRIAVGPAARSLGDAGKKKGLTTTLPVALNLLQRRGVIRRVPDGGRFDQQRYAYTRWDVNPLANSSFAVPSDAPLSTQSDAEQAVNTELARRYFRWSGPATVAEFQWFSGLSLKKARAALEPLQLVTIAGDRALLPEMRDAFEAFRQPEEPCYRLVSSLDGLVLLRRDLHNFVDEADANREFISSKTPVPLCSLSELPSHAIFDRGRLVGLWEFDTQAGRIVWTSFVPKTHALEESVNETEEFIRRDLGDARSFSLDSPQSRAPRIEALRAAGSR